MKAFQLVDIPENRTVNFSPRRLSKLPWTRAQRASRKLLGTARDLLYFGETEFVWFFGYGPLGGYFALPKPGRKK